MTPRVTSTSVISIIGGRAFNLTNSIKSFIISRITMRNSNDWHIDSFHSAAEDIALNMIIVSTI